MLRIRINRRLTPASNAAPRTSAPLASRRRRRSCASRSLMRCSAPQPRRHSRSPRAVSSKRNDRAVVGVRAPAHVAARSRAAGRRPTSSSAAGRARRRARSGAPGRARRSGSAPRSRPTSTPSAASSRSTSWAIRWCAATSSSSSESRRSGGAADLLFERDERELEGVDGIGVRDDVVARPRSSSTWSVESGAPGATASAARRRARAEPGCARGCAACRAPWRSSGTARSSRRCPARRARTSGSRPRGVVDRAREVRSDVLDPDRLDRCLPAPITVTTGE